MDTVIIALTAYFGGYPYPSTFISNMTNVYTHNAVIIILCLIALVLCGIGKWKHRITVRIILLSVPIHMGLDLIFYGLSLSFFYNNLAPFDNFENGLFLGSILNTAVNIPLFTETVFSVLSALFLIIISIRNKTCRRTEK